MRFYYYVDKEGVRQGPLPIEKLTPNEITPNTLVFCKGMKNWQRAKSVDDFYKILNLGDERSQDAKTMVIESNDSHDRDVLLSSIASQYGVIIDAETSSYIRDHVTSKLANVKFIKERFNIGLEEAKEIVDDIYASNGLNQQTIECAETAPVEDNDDDDEDEDEDENEEEEENNDNKFSTKLECWLLGGIIALFIFGMIYHSIKQIFID